MYGKKKAHADRGRLVLCAFSDLGLDQGERCEAAARVTATTGRTAGAAPIRIEVHQVQG
jgi:hypothetical protein